jgi:small subunit ribosomal protein S16
MAVKIRLQRKGRKKAPFYYIVVADSRSPRDGKFIERIGSYNPVPQIPLIDIDADKAVNWLNLGAIPTKTVRTLLSTKGIMYKKHLLRGVKMGVLTEEEAENKFKAFMAEKEDSFYKELKKLSDTEEKAKKAIFDHEIEVNKKRAAALAEKRKAEIAALNPEEENAEEATEETAEEAPVTEATEETVKENTENKEEKVEEKVEEKAEEKVEEKKEEIVEEKKSEPAEDSTENEENKEEAEKK